LEAEKPLVKVKRVKRANEVETRSNMLQVEEQIRNSEVEVKEARAALQRGLQRGETGQVLSAFRNKVTQIEAALAALTSHRQQLLGSLNRSKTEKLSLKF
jgi:flagellar motility protein MotE (MotC chaperone)